LKINRLDVPKAMVGESPVWDAAGQALFWIDILGCAVWRYHPETLAVQSWSLPSPAGSMVLRQGAERWSPWRMVFTRLILPAGPARGWLAARFFMRVWFWLMARSTALVALS
jgi:hypothetical protein